MKPNKPILSRCSACNHIYDFRKVGYTFTMVDTGIEEAGIVCPNCSQWYHSFFTNSELGEIAKSVNGGKVNRKERRAFEARFRRFNKKMRSRFGYQKINGRWVKPETV